MGAALKSAAAAAALAALAALAGLLTPPPAQAQMSRIGEEWRWRAIVVDRVIRQVDGDALLLHFADGTLLGQGHGMRWAGTWDWLEDRVCVVGGAVGAPAEAREARCARAGVGRGRLRLYWNEGGGTEYALR